MLPVSKGTLCPSGENRKGDTRTKARVWRPRSQAHFFANMQFGSSEWLQSAAKLPAPGTSSVVLPSFAQCFRLQSPEPRCCPGATTCSTPGVLTDLVDCIGGYQVVLLPFGAFSEPT